MQEKGEKEGDQEKAGKYEYMRGRKSGYEAEKGGGERKANGTSVSRITSLQLKMIKNLLCPHIISLILV